MVVLLVFTGVYLVSINALTPGTLVALLQIYDRLGNDLIHVAHELIEMEPAMTALASVCQVLNSRLHVSDEMRMRRAVAQEVRGLAREADDASTPSRWKQIKSRAAIRFQTEHMELRRVSFAYRPERKYARSVGDWSAQDEDAEERGEAGETGKSKRDAGGSSFGSAWEASPGVGVLRHEAWKGRAWKTPPQSLSFKSPTALSRPSHSHSPNSRSPGNNRSPGSGSQPDGQSQTTDAGVDLLPSIKPGFEPTRLVFSRLTAKLPLGQCVGVRCEAAGSGLLTFFKLLAGTTFPTAGTIVVPAHLRTILIHPEPNLIDGTLWENLSFGKPDADEEHTWAVAEQLGLSRSLLGRKDTPVGLGGACLRLADRVIVCITRALVTDAQALMFYKLGYGLSVEQRARAEATLADWVGFRGVFSGDLWRSASGTTDALPAGQLTNLDARSAFISIDADRQESLPSICSCCIALKPNSEGAVASCVIRRVQDGKEVEERLAKGSSLFSDRTSGFMSRISSFGLGTERQDELGA